MAASGTRSYQNDSKLLVSSSVVRVDSVLVVVIWERITWSPSLKATLAEAPGVVKDNFGGAPRNPSADMTQAGRSPCSDFSTR